MSQAADKYDVAAVADIMAASIASALVSGGSCTYEHARRTNIDEGWTYELSGRHPRSGECVESIRLDEEQLPRAWLAANRGVDNDMDLVWKALK